MITYTADVICDRCEAEMVVGEATDTPEAAKESAIKMAEKEGWDFFQGKWECHDCLHLKESKSNG